MFSGRVNLVKCSKNFNFLASDIFLKKHTFCLKMGCSTSTLLGNGSKNLEIEDRNVCSDAQEVYPVHRQQSTTGLVPPIVCSDGTKMVKNENCRLKDKNIQEKDKPNSVDNNASSEECKVQKEGFSDTSETMKPCVSVEDDDGGASRLSKKILILHFNDVYNIEPREIEPVGGAARFATKLASLKSRNPLIFFSGDALNPSMISSITKGEQMLPVLNSFGIHAAVYGNHDFDFGVDELVDFASESNFPWLMSNVYDKMTKRPLAEGKTSVIFQQNGHKIGLIGLVEKEWLVTLATLTIDEVDYIDFISEGQKLSQQLRKEGCDFIIALTHMRGPNDKKLAENVPEIDLILGGHDHNYEIVEVNGTKIFKSGTDFRCFSEIEITISEDGSHSIQSCKHEITKDVPENLEIKMIVDRYLEIFKEKMEGVLGQVQVDLDGRFKSIRTQETNLGNLIADITRNATQADIGLLNSGTLRSDVIHPAGDFKMKDLVSILPMPDSIVVLEITGAQLLTALNNGVSQWPRLEGRFPQVSGVMFEFDPDKIPGQRVIERSVTVGAENINLEKKYTLCTKAYLSHGKDGYDVFKECNILIDEEQGPILPTIVRNHFVACNIVKGLQMCRSGHRQSLTVLRPGEELAAVEKRHSSISPKIMGRITVVCEEKNEEDGI